MDDRGLAGVELAYEGMIRGRPGQLLIETDAKQHWLGQAGRPPEPGKKLVLTLDENIQYIAERELAAAVSEFHPVSASVIVQDPQSGDILAMANQPTFNPNTYSESPTEALRNLAVSASYEPGSTFKIVTVASALEENLTEPQERIDCQMGSIVLAGHVIHDHKPYGLLSVNEIIQNSSDVGAIKLALRLGDEKMYRYMRLFGFGAPSGIELPGEARGLTKPPERWSKISIGAIAMGQEVGATPLQIVSVASAVANGGMWLPPHIVREDFRKLSPSTGARRIMSEQTAAAMRKMMTMVMTDGTAKTAQLNGYTSAGKTGTAQKIDPATGTYSHRDYVASFVGFAPAEDPVFSILVLVDSPHGKIYGGDVAAPVFKRIAEQALAYRNIPPSLPGKPSLARAAWVSNKSVATLAEPGAAADEVPSSLSESEAGEDSNGVAMFSLDSGAVVPNWTGKTVRGVAEQAQSEGLPVRMFGSGTAIRQSPAPGAPLRDGQRVSVWFQLGATATVRQAAAPEQPAKRQEGELQSTTGSARALGRDIHNVVRDGSSGASPGAAAASQPELPTPVVRPLPPPVRARTIAATG